MDLKNSQGQTDGWELPGGTASVWGFCSQHGKVGYQHSIFTLHIPSVMPANDSHWYGELVVVMKRKERKNLLVGMKGARTM